VCQARLGPRVTAVLAVAEEDVDSRLSLSLPLIWIEFFHWMTTLFWAEFAESTRLAEKAKVQVVLRRRNRSSL
jgi:hypothetical protein